MGLETMRGGYGRCPPLLLGGLLLICFILTCNWWSLSSQNYELLRQLDEMGEQLRRCTDERDQSIQLRLSVEGRLKSTEEELAQSRVRLEQQDINADDLKKQLEEKDKEVKKVGTTLEGSKNSITMCTTELESLKKLDLSKDDMIASLKIEKEGLISQREERKKELEKLKSELTKAMADINTLKASQAAAAAGNRAQARWRTGNKSPPSVNAVLNVEQQYQGMRGMIYHGKPIIVQDPPDAYRPPPRFSVLHPLKPAGKPSEVVAKVKSAAKPGDLNADEKDEDNAKERDDANGNDAADAEDERFDKNNDDGGNQVPDDGAPEDSVDQMAHAIQEDTDGQGAAQAPPPPGKAATP